MQIIRLENDQLKYFQDMDPFSMSEKVNFINYFALGAVVHNNAKDVDIPMGLMLCSLIDQGLVVEWICVGEKFRSYGVGEKLLVSAFDLAAELGTGKLFAYINEYSEAFTSSQMLYMSNRLFTEDYPVLGEWKASVSEIKASPINAYENKIVSVEKLSGKRMDKIFEDFAKLDNTIFNYPFELKDNGFDGQHSFLLCNDEKLCGGLFTKKVGEVWYVTAISISTKEQGLALFNAFTDSVKDEDEGKEMVSILVRQKPQSYDWYDEDDDTVDYDIIKEMADEVFDGKHYNGRYLAASIYEYIEHIGEEVELEAWDDLAFEALEQV